MKHNFQRRYKWVFDAKYQDVVAAPVGHPELIRFLPALEEITEVSRCYSLSVRQWADSEIVG